MSDRKKWGLAAIITGVILIALGVLVFVMPVTPAWVTVALLVVDVAMGAIGIPLLYKPDVPA